MTKRKGERKGQLLDGYGVLLCVCVVPHVKKGGACVLPQGRCQDFDEYFSINHLPLSALAFCIAGPIRQDDEGEGEGRAPCFTPPSPQVIIEVPVTPSWAAAQCTQLSICSAEEAVSRALQANKHQHLESHPQQEQQCGWVGVKETQKRRDGRTSTGESLTGANVTWSALPGTAPVN